MPIYVYKCPGCGTEREYITPRPLTFAPVCHSDGCAGYFMQRQYTAAAFSIKGFNAKNGYSK